MEEYQGANEISLIGLVFYCLKRWRWIALCMILLAIVAGTYKYRTTIADNQLKKEVQSEKYVTEQAESEQIVLEDPVSTAISFAITGLFGGGCLICLVFCTNYVISGKLQSEDNFQKRFNMSLLGTIRKKETKNRWFGYIDRWICKLEEGPYAKISRKEQIKMAAINVQVAIHRKPEIKKIMFAGTSVGDDVLEICDQLAEKIDNITFSPYGQIVFYATALRKLEYYDGILFIEKKGESYEKLIRQEKEMAMDRGVQVLGVIIC